MKLSDPKHLNGNVFFMSVKKKKKKIKYTFIILNILFSCCGRSTRADRKQKQPDTMPRTLTGLRFNLTGHKGSGWSPLGRLCPVPASSIPLTAVEPDRRPVRDVTSWPCRLHSVPEPLMAVWPWTVPELSSFWMCLMGWNEQVCGVLARDASPLHPPYTCLPLHPPGVSQSFLWIPHPGQRKQASENCIGVVFVCLCASCRSSGEVFH